MAVKGEFKEKVRNKIKEPSRYNVIMYNDDFTTMEFVVEILMDVFRKSAPEAETLMMTVHKSGSAVVGCYTYDIAMTKVSISLKRAREQGFPFKMEVREG